MTCSKVSIMKGSQVNSSSQKSSQVSVLLSAASVTTSKDFLKSNAIKSDTMKFYWSLDWRKHFLGPKTSSRPHSINIKWSLPKQEAICLITVKCQCMAYISLGTKLHPAKIQISLHTRTVWLESSLSTGRSFRYLAIYRVHSADSDHTLRMIGVFAGRLSFCSHCCARLNYDKKLKKASRSDCIIYAAWIAELQCLLPPRTTPPPFFFKLIPISHVK